MLSCGSKLKEDMKDIDATLGTKGFSAGLWDLSLFVGFVLASLLM
jgi:hypothetical protein